MQSSELRGTARDTDDARSHEELVRNQGRGAYGVPFDSYGLYY